MSNEHKINEQRTVPASRHDAGATPAPTTDDPALGGDDGGHRDDAGRGHRAAAHVDHRYSLPVRLIAPRPGRPAAATVTSRPPDGQPAGRGDDGGGIQRLADADPDADDDEGGADEHAAVSVLSVRADDDLRMGQPDGDSGDIPGVSVARAWLDVQNADADAESQPAGRPRAHPGRWLRFRDPCDAIRILVAGGTDQRAVAESAQHEVMSS